MVFFVPIEFRDERLSRFRRYAYWIITFFVGYFLSRGY